MNAAEKYVMPQAGELEQKLLGAIIYGIPVMDRISFLTAEMFYIPKHRIIFRAIHSLISEGNPVDITTVYRKLTQMNQLEEAGGVVFVSAISSDTHPMAGRENAEFHGRIVWQKYLQREMIFATDKFQKKCFDETADVLDLLDEFSETAMRLRMSIDVGREMQHVQRIISEEIKEYDAKTQALAKGLTIGVNSGYRVVNANTGGWQPSDLIILAARPAMGKTAFMVCTAKSAAQHKVPVGIFSLEMSSLQLVKRMLQQESEIDPKDYKNARLGNGEIIALMQARDNLRQLGMYIDDTSALPIMELRDKARRLKQQHDVGMILVDYLQLINGRTDRGMNREAEIANISRNLKAMAKELNVPVIALSQVSRKTEDRPDKRPQLSDLRESGAIEQDADMVLFLHRPEYYGFTQDEDGNDTAGVAELIIAKHRNGDTGVIKLAWQARLTKFSDPQESYTSAPLTPNVNFQHEPKKDADPF